MKRVLLSSFLLILFSFLVFGQNTPIPMDSSIRIGKLPNGLTYYIKKNGKPEKRVELRLAVNAGSVQEDDDQLGLAHFCEHMSFNGTSHFPKNDLVHYLQSVGVNFGAEINGSTSFEETVYMLTVPSDSSKIIENGFQIMADWAHSVTFDTTEINKERGVILEEWRLGRGAGQRMRDKYLPNVLYGSKYAKRLPIGTKESIENSTYDQIKRFYNDWYRPDLMAFVVVGDINPDSMEYKVKNYFSAIPSSKNPRAKEVYKINDNEKPLVSIVSDKENTGISISIYEKKPDKQLKVCDDLKERINRSLFCSMINQRLGEIARKPVSPFTGASLGYGQFNVRTCEASRISIGSKQDSVIAAIKAVMTEVERAKRYGFLQAELERTKKNMLTSLESQYKERDKRVSGGITEECLGNFLNNEPLVSIEFFYKFAKEYLPLINLNDINVLVDNWLQDKNRVVILTGIEKEGLQLPKEDQLLSAIDEVKNYKIEPYKEEEIAKELIAQNFKPRPGKIVSEKAIGTRGVVELKLQNGVTVLYKQTDFKNDDIQMEAYSEGGRSTFGPEYKLAKQYASSIIAQSGVSKFPGPILSKVLAGKNVGLSLSITDLYSGFRGASTSSDLETLFQLIHLFFTQPRCDSTIYETLKQRVKEDTKYVLANPTNYFYNEVNKIRYKGAPEIPGALPTEEDWQNFTLLKVFEVYYKNFSNASNFTFMFAGSLKPDTLKYLAEMYLGSLPSKNKKETFIDRKIRPVKGPVNESVFKGNDPKAIVTLYMKGKAKWSKKYSHAFWSLTNILQRVYTDKLREELSGVYGFDLSGSLDKVPYESYNFSLTIPCAPENTDKLVNAAYAEIERIKKYGPTPDEFKKEIETQHRTEETNDRDNYSWIFRIRMVYQYEKDFGRVDKPYELADQMTPELIKEMAVKYLDTSKFIRVTLYPENFKKDNTAKKD